MRGRALSSGRNSADVAGAADFTGAAGVPDFAGAAEVGDFGGDAGIFAGAVGATVGFEASISFKNKAFKPRRVSRRIVSLARMASLISSLMVWWRVIFVICRGLTST